MPTQAVGGNQQPASEGTASDATVEKMIADFGQRLQQSLETIKRDVKKKIAAEKMAAVKKDLGIPGKPLGGGTADTATWLADLPPDVQKQIKAMTQEQPEVAHPKSAVDVKTQIAVSLFAKESEIVARLWFDNPKERQAYQDLKLLDWASHFKFMPGGRAQLHLKHYLEGSGRPLHLDLRQLLKDNPKVRQRASDMITRALVPSLTYSFRYDPAAVKAHEFPIRQRDYNSETLIGNDWHLAVGTYFIFWEIVTREGKGQAAQDGNRGRGPICTSNLGPGFIDGGTLCRARSLSPDEKIGNTKIGSDLKSLPKYARIYGVKEYHWHAITDRATAAVHAAGFRLKDEIGAKNYDMVGDPCEIEIATGQPTN